MLGIDDLDIVRNLDVRSSHDTLGILAQAQSHLIAVVQLEHDALEVEQDVDHIFLHAVNGGILVQNSGDGHLGDGIADHGRQLHATQGIAQRMAIATLERLQRHLGAIAAQLLHMDVLGFQQIGLHSDFLSIPPARYTGKAGEAPDACKWRQEPKQYDASASSGSAEAQTRKYG